MAARACAPAAISFWKGRTGCRRLRRGGRGALSLAGAIGIFEQNAHLEIAKEGYMLSVDGFLMPTRKNQPPPDLRYFKQTQK